MGWFIVSQIATFILGYQIAMMRKDRNVDSVLNEIRRLREENDKEV